MLVGGLKGVTGGFAGGASAGATGPALGFSDVSASAGGGWDTWLVSLLNVLTQMRGASDQLMPLTGIAIPLINGIDALSSVALLTPHVATALQRLTGLPGPLPHDKLNEDNEITVESGNVLYGQISAKSISWVTYLAAIPSAIDASVRSSLSTANVEVSPGKMTTVTSGAVTNVTNVGNAIRLVKFWQASMDQAVQAITANGANGVGAILQPLNASAFFTALQHLTSMLDQSGEDSASSKSAVLQQGISAAKDAFVGLAEKGANLMGEALAATADEAGRLAGNVAAGFFSQIGAIGYAVVAIVIYMAFYR